MLNLSPEDHYQLRKMQMDTEKKSLELQKSRQDLERFVLDLEYKHGLIAEGKTLDAQTAKVNELISIPNSNGNGQKHVKELVAASAE
jgi:hypothetical protein